MPALFELASKANGHVTFCQATAVGVPRREYPRPSVSRLWDTLGLFGARDRAPCAIEALVQASFSKKYAKSVSYFGNSE